MKKKTAKLMKKVTTDLDPEDVGRGNEQEEQEEQEEQLRGVGEQVDEMTAQELEEEKERAEFESLMQMADEMKRERAMRED